MTRYAVSGADRTAREWAANRLRQRALIAVGYSLIDWTVDPPVLDFPWTLSGDELALLGSISTAASTATVPMVGVVTSTAGPGGTPHPNEAAHEALGLAPAHGHPYEATGAVATHALTPHGGPGSTLGTISASGTAVSINVGTTDWDITLTANCTLTLSAPPANAPTYLTLVFHGAFTVTWPGTVSWITGTPVLSGTTTIVLYTPNGSTPWQGTSTAGHAHPFAAASHTHPAGHTHVWNETPSDGGNATYGLAAAPNPAASLLLYRNGLLMRAGSGNDYTLLSATVTFLQGNEPNAGDILLASYTT